MTDEARDAGRGAILIVDDNPANLEVLSRMLRERGYRFRVARSGARAITSARSEPPDLVMLDITMPEMDGYQVCEALKMDPRTAGVPVIFISALDDALDKVRAFRVGGADYVGKPFQLEEVLARIEHQLRISRLQEDLARRNRELSAKNEELLAVSRELERANGELERLSRSDALTGLANRRHLMEVLDRESRRAARARLPFSLVIVDVDFFKQYNDVYGHQAGDECLRRVSAALRDALRRPEDFVGRYGGEEFVVALPGTDAAGAQEVGRKLCEAVRRCAIPHDRSQAAPVVSISGGVATLEVDTSVPLDALLARADEALYRAKREGRDRVLPHARADLDLSS
jgi:diguanylate cyclase (GGDEF)-like protein